MDRDLSDGELISTFRAEVGSWAPKHVPSLLDLASRTEHHWRRPVALASEMAALTLAFVLVLSLLVVVAVPANVPGIGYVKDHLVTQPVP